MSIRRRITAAIIATFALLGFGGMAAASAGASVTATHYVGNQPATHYVG